MSRRAIVQSIALRLSASFALASALLLAAMGFYLAEALETVQTSRQERPLTAMAMIVRNMMDEIPSLERLSEQPNIVGHLLVGHAYLSLWIYGEDGRTLFASSPWEVPSPEWKSIAAPDIETVPSKLWKPANRDAFRLAVARFNSKRREIGSGFIVLTLDVSEPERLVRSFKVSLFGAIPVGVLLAALIGTFIAKRQLRPVVRIADAARHVTASHMNERLDLTGVPTELQDLANSFNTMLARLEDSFHRLSGFSSDLAHELRTPLTSLLGRTQLVLSKQRSAEEYHEALELSIDEIKRLAALVSDMLFLAQADYAETVLAYERVDLRDQADRLIEFFGVIAEEREIVLEAHGHATVFADRAMLGRALSNLLSNAIRHSPDGGRVDVVLAHGKSGVSASVIDRGPGLSPAEVSRVFERFYRADPSRTRHSGGIGLGLAIARSIMRMHGGDVSVKSEPGKLTIFTMNIPERVHKPETKSAVSLAQARAPALQPVTHETSLPSPPR